MVVILFIILLESGLRLGCALAYLLTPSIISNEKQNTTGEELISSLLLCSKNGVCIDCIEFLQRVYCSSLIIAVTIKWTSRLESLVLMQYNMQYNMQYMY